MVPRFTLLIAVYNARPFLRECLDSLLGQTLADFEAICVDDASTDGSLALLAEYAARDKRFHVVHLGENQGQAHARNVALRQARGELVAMLDADDWLAPDTLQSAYDALANHPGADCAVLRLMEVRPDGQVAPYGVDGWGEWPMDGAGESIPGEEAFRLSLDWRLHGLYAVRTPLHQRLPYDETCRLYSDDNTARLHYLHSRGVVRCQGRYFYRKHEASATSACSIRHFDHLVANLSLKRQLDALAQGDTMPHVRWDSLLALWEEHRWRNLVAHYRYYQRHAQSFTPAERGQITNLLRRVHRTMELGRLPWALCRQPAFLPLRPYGLFAAWQRLCMLLRKRNNPL